MSTAKRIATFIEELEKLGPSRLEDDPELHRQIDRLAEVIDGLCWEMSDGAPRFRPGRLVQEP